MIVMLRTATTTKHCDHKLASVCPGGASLLHRPPRSPDSVWKREMIRVQYTFCIPWQVIEVFKHSFAVYKVSKVDVTCWKILLEKLRICRLIKSSLYCMKT
jgi:hypothetical protein